MKRSLLLALFILGNYCCIDALNQKKINKKIEQNTIKTEGDMLWKYGIQLRYLITAPVMLKTGPSRILRGPVKIQKEHHIEPPISKYQDTTFMTKFVKLQMAPDAESNFMMWYKHFEVSNVFTMNL